MYSFFSFYKEKNQKKIVVARIARCSRHFCLRNGFHGTLNDRLPID